MRVTRILLLTTLLTIIGVGSVWADECRLMRFPDIHKDRVVFTYAGDLWTAASAGGDAVRLTTHPGTELHAKFSPDGKYIAFTGKYDGDEDVYLVPAEGGQPVQLTFHPAYDMVLGWFPDGKHILFRSGREAHSGANSKLYKVSIDGGMPEALPLPESGLASLSPEGDRLAYNRRFREFRTWKRYKGGTSQDVWIYDLGKNEIEKITDWEGTDNSPMWVGNKIYFNSDRKHELNLFAYDLNDKTTKQVTKHTKYDVKWPSAGPGAIVYENGGYLYALDLATEKSQKITVNVRGDLVLTRPRFENVTDLIHTFALSPAGKRAVFGARGEVFTVPAEKGDIRNITRTPGIRELYATWSPDGKWIAYFSEKNGEYDIYLKAQDGSDEEKRVTSDADCYRFGLEWSPDSKKLMYTDKKFRLFYVDIDEGRPVLVVKSDFNHINHFSWSPDSKWIAYSNYHSQGWESPYLYSLDEKKSYRIGDDMTDDYNPVFDPGGKYLFFVSGRNFAPTFSDFEREYVYKNSRNIYLVTLEADTPSPFAPESDEVEIKEDEEDEDGDDGDDEDKDAGKDEDDGEDKDGDGEDEDSDDLKIDFDGIEQRIVGVPTKAGNYGSLRAVEGKLLYMVYPAINGEGKTELHMYDIEEREEHTLMSGLDAYDLSADGKKIIYQANGSYGIIDVAAKKSNPGDGSLKLAGLKMKVDPKAEWAQIFNEAWRLERDFFYDPNMHGLDWPGIRDQYAELLPYVAHRSDLGYLLGEMIGELSTSHAYVGGGKMPEVSARNVGLLGADYEIDPGSGYYRFAKIYSGENWSKSRRAPLTEPAVGVNTGDYLISVDGVELKAPENIYSLFENTVGRQVTIKVNDKPNDDGAREYTVVPVSSEGQLRYMDWVSTNRRLVSEATDGKVGYVHVPNTGYFGLNEFSRAYFAQVRRDGLIIDVRHNGGGMIPEMFMERLDRKLLSLWAPREGKMWRTPNTALHGHLVCIADEYAGSGGDALPFYFKQMGLGPVIGNRTWGGLVGIRRSVPLMDGGVVTFPEFAFINLKGEWDVENKGVVPDIPVDNLPNLVAEGQDPQLEKAIEVIRKKVQDEPMTLPSRPTYPIKR